MVYHKSYISRANKKMSSDDLKQLEDFAASNNVKYDITGFLVYDGFHFFQYIEGPEENINQLYSNIEKDGRHSGVTEMSSGEIPFRLLPKWSMKNFLPADFVAEDRVHIMNILEQKHDKDYLVEVLKGLQVRDLAV